MNAVGALVSVIDEHFFGDEASFRSTYVSASANKNALLFLRKRLEPVCKRTLRRQVQQAGLIKYTERIPLTLEFEPEDQSAFFDRRAQIRSEVDEMLDRIQESLKIEPTLTPLFTVRWALV